MSTYGEAQERAALAYLTRRAEGDAWREDALCLELGSRLFYPERIEGTTPPQFETPFEAVRACAMCPVMAECRARALATREPEGVWGGMTDRAREKALATPEATRQALLDALNGVVPTVRKKKTEDPPVGELQAA